MRVSVRAAAACPPSTARAGCRRSGIWRGFFALGLLGLAALVPAHAADAPSRLRPLLDRTHELNGIVVGYFDLASERRVARLELEHISLAYRHQGFLRVAWRPQVVMDGVTLEVVDAAAWPGQAAEVCRTLRELGGSDELILHRVCIRLAGEPGCVITAGSARLNAAGGLLLVDAFSSEAGAPPVSAGNQMFWLGGPDAGRLQPVPAVPPSSARSLSITQTSP